MTETRGRCRTGMTVCPDIISDRSVTVRLTSGPPVARSRFDSIVGDVRLDLRVGAGRSLRDVEGVLGVLEGRTAISYGSNTSKSPGATPAPVPVATQAYW